MEINEILLKPVLTEKSTNLAKNNVYTFEVNLTARSSQIKKAIETCYQVKVKEIRVLRRKGKKRRVGRRLITKKMPDLKIAYVTLKEGKLDLFPKA